MPAPARVLSRVGHALAGRGMRRMLIKTYVKWPAVSESTLDSRIRVVAGLESVLERTGLLRGNGCQGWEIEPFINADAFHRFPEHVSSPGYIDIVC